MDRHNQFLMFANLWQLIPQEQESNPLYHIAGGGGGEGVGGVGGGGGGGGGGVWWPAVLIPW